MRNHNDLSNFSTFQSPVCNFEMHWNLWRVLHLCRVKLVHFNQILGHVADQTWTAKFHVQCLQSSWVMGFSLNGAELSLNSVNLENLRNHRSMNWVKFKNPLYYLCLCGTDHLCLLTRKIVGSNSEQQSFLLSILFVTEFSELNESWQIQKIV